MLLTSCSTNIVRYVYSFDEVISDEADFKYDEIIFGRYRHLYSDKNIELLFDIAPYEIGIKVKNPSRDTLRIIWDNVYLTTDFDPIKKFDLIHTNRLQELISLSDSTIEDYEVLKILKQKRTEDSIYIIKPTIILPGMTFSDVILNKRNGFFMPYEMKDETMLSNSASAMKGRSVILYFQYKVNSKLIKTSFKLGVKNYYLLRKG